MTHLILVNHNDNSYRPKLNLPNKAFREIRLIVVYCQTVCN
jgi:hypothetical protein